ncbi:MAG TPA: XRE family transcriptional regulator [Chloroflexi bacterium]|nr:XRE family transcriptional regulator [Chloroflexota bacterium]
MPQTSYSAVQAEKVGARIRSTRQALSLTQAEVARRLGVSPSYVAAVEAGRENLTVGQLANIANAMGAGLDIEFAVPSREYESLRIAEQ